MSAYYNEFDPFAAEWLRELIKDGLIADGVVDERSIEDVDPKDIREFTQCHFFAGIGGWSYAARLAGWPDDRPMWTGSPPCQPFSTAGNQKGKDDLRHLWPVFFNLIRECAPPVIFGEQVAAAIRHGWFDDLQADLERESYASGMVVLPACSVGAPHKRDRLFYVAERLADTESYRDSRGLRQVSGENEKQQALKEQGQEKAKQCVDGSESSCTLGDAEHDGSHGAKVGRGATETSDYHTQRTDVSSEPAGASRPAQSGNIRDTSNTSSGMADTYDSGQQRSRELRRSIDTAQNGDREINRVVDADSFSRFWEGSHYVYCRDGKYRQIPTEPALFPLANGVPNRVGTLRGAGNAIVPQVGAEVIRAFMEK